MLEVGSKHCVEATAAVMMAEAPTTQERSAERNALIGQCVVRRWIRVVRRVVVVRPAAAPAQAPSPVRPATTAPPTTTTAPPTTTTTTVTAAMTAVTAAMTAVASTTATTAAAVAADDVYVFTAWHD